jgi:replicative DNA helicase
MSHDRLINETAEAALLGAMMLNGQLITELADRVSPEDFGDALHGRIYSAMLRFSAKGMRADAMTLRPIFAADGDAQYGAYLDQLVDSPAVVAAATAIAEQVADLAARRKARDVMRDAMESLHADLDKPVDEICGQVEAVGWAAVNRSRVDVAYNPGEMAGLVEDRDNRIASDPGAVGITNGLLSDVDRGLGALEAGTYNLLAGRPGMGKSSVASSLALGYAINGHAGLYLQHEMTAEQMALRATSDLAHAMGYPLPHQSLRKGGLRQEERMRLRAVRDRAALLPLKFVCPGPIDIRRLWSLAAQHRAMYRAVGRKLEFLIIDQMILLRAHDEEGRPIIDDRKRMNFVSSEIKRLAAEMDLVIIALAHLSRGVESRPSKRPILSDLKESGNLEQDADTVTLLYRDEYYLEQSEPKRGEKDVKGRDMHEDWEAEMHAARNKIDLIFAKNRHGRSSTRTARFFAEHSAVRSGDFDEFSDDPILL